MTVKTIHIRCCIFIVAVLFAGGIILPGCDSKENSKQTLFEALDHDKTGLDFANTLKPGKEFNMFNNT